MIKKKQTNNLLICDCVSYYLDDECKLDGINVGIPQVYIIIILIIRSVHY